MGLRSKPAALVFTALTMLGCGDRIILRSEAGLTLTYACDDIPALAKDSESIELVRAAARDLLNEAGRAGTAAWGARIEAQLDNEEIRPLERQVVLYMCDSGAKLDHGDALQFPDSGSDAPEFELQVAITATSSDQTIISLTSHRGDLVLLDFWASWCIPCVSKQPYVAGLAAKYASRGLHVYGVLVNDREAAAERWLRTEGTLTYPFLADPAGAVAEKYGVRGIPRMFLIGPNGKLLAHCFGCAAGTMSPARLEAWLESLLGPGGPYRSTSD